MYFKHLIVSLYSVSLIASNKRTLQQINRRKFTNNSIKMLRGVISAKDAIEMFKTNKNLKFLDGSWHLNKERNAKQEYSSSRIPGAKFFDVDSICDKKSNLPHMLPSAEFFSQEISSMGISNGDPIIVYATKGCFSAPRVWWTFQVFNHENIAILDGGLEEWIKEGGPTENGDYNLNDFPGSFSAYFNDKFVCDWKRVLNAVETGNSQILDARSSARFKGEAPEPRAGLRGGHIPGSLNLPFNLIMQDDDVTKFKSPEDIRDKFKEAGIIFGSNVITSCGSGVTAATLTFALYLLGKKLDTSPIYDGSWSEWGGDTNLPVTK